MSQSSFLQMPLHLISLILSELDSMQSLGCAILSHSSVYAAFNENPKTVMFRILLNQIPPNLMVYAAITYEASLEEYRSTRKLHELFSWVSDHRNIEPPYFYEDSYLRMKLEDRSSGPAFAASLSKTHMLVEHFTDRYLSDTLPLAARDLFEQSQINTERPSENEVFRIRRAFYRFQLHCNMTCGEDDNPDSDGQEDDEDDPVGRDRAYLFFLHFPPWVNEQLACIQDYLEGLLSKAFDEVASHDIEWGAKSVDWISNRICSEYKQTCLSYGLHFLSQVHRANTYDERLRLLKSKGLPYSSHGLATDLFERGAPVHELSQHCSEALGRWSIDNFHNTMKDNDGVDVLDSSPFDAWRYVHRHRLARNSVFAASRYRLRLCGYVFWDAPEQGLERSAFRKRLMEAKRQGREDIKLPKGAREEMERSWKERAEVLSQGGHGYWTRGDLSKVVWDDGRNLLGSADVSSL